VALTYFQLAAEDHEWWWRYVLLLDWYKVNTSEVIYSFPIIIISKNTHIQPQKKTFFNVFSKFELNFGFFFIMFLTLEI
jgi:hypothetical protein